MATEAAPAPQPTQGEETPLLHRFLEGVGGPFTFVGREIFELIRVFALTFFYLFYRPIRWREVVRQCYEMGYRSMFFIAVVMGFLGMIMVMQTGLQAQKMLGDLSMIGALFLQLLFRELGPTITAAMIAVRVGTGLAAEIGSMVVTEQVDALRMNDAEPVQYLIVPRVIACLFMTIVLTCIAMVISFASAMAGAYLMFDLNPRTFYNTDLLIWGDFITFAMKSLAYGIVIPVIGCHAGLAAFGGSEGVGMATTRAVVNASLGITFVDFALSAFGFVFIY